MADNVHRRAFLRYAAAGSVVTAVGSAFWPSEPQALAQTPIPRTGGPWLKTSLNAYSFSKPLNDAAKMRGAGMSLFQLLDYCAEQNFDGVDPTGYFFPGYPKVPGDSFLNDFKRRAHDLGLGFSGTGVRNDLATPDKDARARDVQHIKEWVEVAARMGAPVLRVFSGKRPPDVSWDQAAKWMVDDLNQCVEHAAKFGVIIGIQNHADFLTTSEEVLKIVRLVDSPWFGVIVDTGFFPGPDPYEHIARVISHAVNWQIKEKVDTKDGNQKTDLRRLLKLIRAANYRGYLPIETLSIAGESYDPKARVAELLAELRSALRDTA
jgi:sugar phosphate isomerase/epimerase